MLNPEQPLQAARKSYILHDLYQLNKKQIAEEQVVYGSALYFPEEDEPWGLPAPATKTCCHGNNLLARQALGMVKIALNPKGLKWFVYSTAWSYTTTRQVLFPANFHWRGLGH